MKLIVIVVLAIFSFNALSQSYLVMENGIIITTDTNGFSYDFGHYTYPNKMTLKGGQYFVEDENILVTIDEEGLLFRKYEHIPNPIRGKGINYFISGEGEVYTFDQKGFLRIFQSESYKQTLNFGGNYFIVSKNAEKTEMELFVVTSEGDVKKAESPSLRIKEIVSFGGNYFMTNRGALFTVTSDGRVVLQNQKRIGVLLKRGGNFFVDYSNILYTVSTQGDLIMPALPASLRVSSILKLGSNYFIDQSGRFFVVDKNGIVAERQMNDHDFRRARIISL